MRYLSLQATTLSNAVGWYLRPVYMFIVSTVIKNHKNKRQFTAIKNLHGMFLICILLFLSSSVLSLHCCWYGSNTMDMDVAERCRTAGDSRNQCRQQPKQLTWFARLSFWWHWCSWLPFGHGSCVAQAFLKAKDRGSGQWHLSATSLEGMGQRYVMSPLWLPWGDGTAHTAQHFCFWTAAKPVLARLQDWHNKGPAFLLLVGLLLWEQADIQLVVLLSLVSSVAAWHCHTRTSGWLGLWYCWKD